MLSGFLIRWAVVPSSCVFESGEFCEDNAFDIWAFERHVTTICSQYLDGSAIKRGRSLLPVGLQFRLVECLVTNEHDVSSHGCSLIELKRVVLANYRRPPDARMISPVSQPESSDARKA